MNDETRTMSLWIANDEALYLETRDMNAKELRNFMTNVLTDDQAGLLLDILNLYLSRINWQELVDTDE